MPAESVESCADGLELTGERSIVDGVIPVCCFHRIAFDRKLFMDTLDKFDSGSILTLVSLSHEIFSR